MTYYPGPNDGYTSPQQPPAPPPPAESKRRWLPWAVLAVAVVFLGSGVSYAYEYRIKKDSGIAACEAFRDDKTVDGKAAKSNDEPITEQQYLQFRKVFQDSRYDDIKAAGTKMIDVTWQVSQLGKDPGLEALPYLGQITSALTELQGACANHGIVIKIDLTGGASPDASEPALSEDRPACAGLIQDGKVIDTKALANGCTDADGEWGTGVGDLPCTDKRHLFVVTSVPGLKDGWGWGGEKFHAVNDPINDKAYNDATTDCLS